MTMTAAVLLAPDALSALPVDPDFLAYRAEFVVEKLFMNKTVATRQEGERLLEEAKRYLWLTHAYPERSLSMISLRVDEAWHQFVLFTVAYTDFCQHFFGHYLHHLPANISASDPRPVATWDEFSELYQVSFGEAPSSLWHDDQTVILTRRLARNRDGLTVALTGGRAVLSVGERVLARVDARAADALAFVADKAIFYVRELPGLVGADQLILAKALVRAGVLRAMP